MNKNHLMFAGDNFKIGVGLPDEFFQDFHYVIRPDGRKTYFFKDRQYYAFVNYLVDTLAPHVSKEELIWTIVETKNKYTW